MAKTRRDDRGRVLKKGEVQRASDKRYMYTYTDPMGRRRFIYANDLTELREKEKKLIKDQMDGLDLYVAGKATVNDTFDRYLFTKFQLREITRSNYVYMYDKYVRETFGKKKIAEIKNPSDGVMKEICRESDKTRGMRRALTLEQQRAFMGYIANMTRLQDISPQ